MTEIEKKKDVREDIPPLYDEKHGEVTDTVDEDLVPEEDVEVADDDVESTDDSEEKVTEVEEADDDELVDSSDPFDEEDLVPEKETESEDEPDDTDDGEETVPVTETIDYKAKYEEEARRRSLYEQQSLTSNTQNKSTPNSTLKWNDPQMMQAYNAIEANDEEALNRISPSVRDEAQSLLVQAQENQKMVAFSPDEYVDKFILPIVDQLVQYRLQESNTQQEFTRKNGDYVNENASRIQSLAQETGIKDNKVLLRILQTEDKVRELSSKQNKQKGKIKQAKTLQKETKKRMKGKKRRVANFNSAAKVNPMGENFAGEVVPKSFSELARDIELQEKMDD